MYVKLANKTIRENIFSGCMLTSMTKQIAAFWKCLLDMSHSLYD
jgi:hypothetical protein